ncbi:MAG TPA: 5-oxoprolinase subunit PxpB [Gemmatimonadaceae bacterium]|nr:5-oxoprolinase subunit PxpB [Gemmatimonadaceae bacterium]
MRTQLRAHPLGDSAITIAFGAERSPELLRQIHSTARALEAAKIPHVEDIVPAYLAVTVFYDSLHASYEEMASILLERCDRSQQSASPESLVKDHRIPVRYDGVDLEWVCSSTGLSTEEIAARHSARIYTVDLLGFVPGFAYLSELDVSLQLPRRAQPRPRVARGSVAIAAAQTAVYPLDTPGGWHIIGSTATVMFDPTRDPPALLSPGDRVSFERVK